jgi:hypothetical protein
MYHRLFRLEVLLIILWPLLTCTDVNLKKLVFSSDERNRIKLGRRNECNLYVTPRVFL